MSSKRSSLASLAFWVTAAGIIIDPSTAAAANANLPSRSEVLAVMNLAADYAQHRFPATVDAFWDDGVYQIGMMALYDVTQSDEVLAYTERFGSYNNWILDRGGTGNRHNRLAAGQSWIAAHDRSSVADIEDTRAEVAAQTVASLAAVTSGAYFSVDSQFMALPAFAMLGKLDGNTGYFGRLYDLFDYNKTTLGLYDPAAHLYYRDESFIYPAKQTPNGRKVFWSRGNGWALAALARILRDLPLNDPARAEYVATFQQMSAALKGVQRADGLWNMSLYDPAHHPGLEVSGTALFVYGMAWGINNGLLSRSTYRPVVARAWNAIVSTALHADGKLGYVQGVGFEPVPASQVTFESTADFGVGAFLLAGSEVARMAVDGTKYEAEGLVAIVSSGDSEQDIGDAWASAGQYNYGAFEAVNDFVQYSVWLATPGTYNVKVRFGRGPNMGRWQFYTAGGNVGVWQGGYSTAFRFTEVNLGNVTYRTSGNKMFRFTVTGKNSASSGYATGIDYVMLTQQ